MVQADITPSGLSKISQENILVDIKEIETKVEDSMHAHKVDATLKDSKPKTRKVGIALQTLGFDILPYFVLSLVPYFFVVFFADFIFKKMQSSPISYQYPITKNIGMGILSIILFGNMPLTITLHSILLPIVDYARYRYYFTDHYNSFKRYINQNKGIYKTYNLLIPLASLSFLYLDFLLWRLPKMRRFCKAGYASRLDYQPTNCTVIDMLAKILLGSDVYTRPKQQTIEDNQDTDNTDTDTETIEQVIIEEVIDTDSTIDPEK